MRRKALLVLLIVFGLVAAACGSDDDGDSASTGDDTETTEAADDGDDGDDGEASGDYATLRVPEDYATIQEAVDAAETGDLVLIGEGTYNEAVVIETEGIVVRGVDRNKVILDGQQDLENGFKIFSNGVAIENLTVSDFTSNGVFFTGDYDSDVILTGYRASYVTVHNNGNYGLYAFNAQNGLFEKSYGSGQPDSAVYIGQCQPCDAVVTEILGEYNALGFTGTNAGGELYVINNEFRNNRIGIVPNSQNSEELAPQRTGVFAGNWVHDNGNEETPRKASFWDLGFGVGIVIAGGENDDIFRNLVEDNVRGGIGVSSFPGGDSGDPEDPGLFDPVDNRVIENVVSGSGEADLVYLPFGTYAANNCFADNVYETSSPENIEDEYPCEGEKSDAVGDFVPGSETAYASIDHVDVVRPSDQPTMPDALTAPPEPAFDVFEAPDVEAITVPEGA